MNTCDDIDVSVLTTEQVVYSWDIYSICISPKKNKKPCIARDKQTAHKKEY